MKYLFSPSQKTFYPESLLSEYEKAGTLPSDVIGITEGEASKYQGAIPPAGKALGSDENGRPVWADKPEPTQAEMDAEKAKSEHAWVKSELERVDEKLRYHWTDDRDRKRHTEQAWKDYAIALRDYTSTDADGNPVMVGASRPSINDYV